MISVTLKTGARMIKKTYLRKKYILKYIRIKKKLFYIVIFYNIT